MFKHTPGFTLRAFFLHAVHKLYTCKATVRPFRIIQKRVPDVCSSPSFFRCGFLDALENGAPGMIRTCDRLIRSHVIYQRRAQKQRFKWFSDLL